MSVLRNVWLLILLIGAPATSAAQLARPLQGPAPSRLFAARTPGPLDTGWAPPDSVRPLSQTYMKEGAIIGGALGAVAGGFFAELGCGLSEDPNKNCTGIFLLGGIIGAPFGALPGALIGGLFPRHPKNTKSPGPNED